MYRWCEYVALGPWLERTRRAFLPVLAGHRRALVLGDGDGRFTAALLRTYPHLRVTAIDASHAMLELLRTRCAVHADRLTILQADIRVWAPLPMQEPFDLVVTHFFLDCLSTAELEALTAQLAPSLEPGCCWLLSEFQVPPGLLELPARLYIRLLYLAFRVLTGLRVERLPAFQAVLAGSGWRLMRHKSLLGGLLTAHFWTQAED